MLNLLCTIAAEAFTSALIITPLPIAATPLSDNELTAIELKFVPSATNKLPADDPSY